MLANIKIMEGNGRSVQSEDMAEQRNIDAQKFDQQ